MYVTLFWIQISVAFGKTNEYFNIKEVYFGTRFFKISLDITIKNIVILIPK